MSQPDPDPIANHLDHLGRRFDRSQPIAQPEGYVLVQVKQLAQWREWANNVAAWSKQADRSSEVARLKASISSAMISATLPPASAAGDSGAGERNIHHSELLIEMWPPTPKTGMIVGMSKGVKITHRPTGTAVTCDSERSQHLNRDKALDMLYAALATKPQAVQPATPPAQTVQDSEQLPPQYMLAKLQMVMPLFQEARDALTAITEAQRKLHGISSTLADRMDDAGTFSLDEWNAASTRGDEVGKTKTDFTVGVEQWIDLEEEQRKIRAISATPPAPAQPDSYDEGYKQAIRDVEALMPAQPSPEPSDAELNELAQHHTWFNGSHAMTNYPAFARAAIARWGATIPPASAAGDSGAGEIVLPDPLHGYQDVPMYSDVEVRAIVRAALATKPQAEQPATPPAQTVQDSEQLPPQYMLAKLQMVMPLFQEARDALTAITEAQRKLHGISSTLADRMDDAGTFSLDEWNAASTRGDEVGK